MANVVDRAGEVVEKFKLLQLLGAGGMGQVYRAEHTYTKREVALKLLLGGNAASDTLFARFQKEAQAAALVGHPSLVQIIDFGKDKSGLPFMAMELLTGEDLAQLLSRTGPLSIPMACYLVHQVLDGVEAAHRNGVIHRDLKPENIFIHHTTSYPYPIVKILDFGISKFTQTEMAGGGLTKAGAILGTPHYMSYEQASGEPVDARTDIYAMGTILYQLLTNVIPFARRSVGAVILAIAEHKLPRPRTLRPEIPPSLDAIVMNAMAKNREERFETAREFQELLAPFFANYAVDLLFANPAVRPSEQSPVVGSHGRGSATTGIPFPPVVGGQHSRSAMERAYAESSSSPPGKGTSTPFSPTPPLGDLSEVGTTPDYGEGATTCPSPPPFSKGTAPPPFSPTTTPKKALPWVVFLLLLLGSGAFVVWYLVKTRSPANSGNKEVQVAPEGGGARARKATDDPSGEANAQTSLPEVGKPGEEYLIWASASEKELEARFTSIVTGFQMNPDMLKLKQLLPTVTLLCKKQHSSACAMGALIYQTFEQNEKADLFVQRLKAGAEGFLEQAAVAGRVRWAQFQKGSRLVAKRLNTPLARTVYFQSLDRQCSEGSGEQCLSLGILTLYSVGDVESTKGRAVEFFHKGCEKGHAMACLGYCNLVQALKVTSMYRRALSQSARDRHKKIQQRYCEKRLISCCFALKISK